MTVQQFMDFRSKYLDIYDSFAVKNDDPKKGYQVPEEESSMVGEPDPLEEAATGMAILISAWNSCIVILSMLPIYWS